MKKLINVFCLLVIVFLNSCDNTLDKSSYENPQKIKPTSIVNNPRSANDITNIGNLGILSFKDSIHDFGKVKQGEVVEYDFEYTNTGKSPVMIIEAHASCGCTVPDYSTEPLEPNKKSIMKVKFNSEGKNGYQHKTVIIKNNGNPGELQLVINAEVI